MDPSEHGALIATHSGINQDYTDLAFDGATVNTWVRPMPVWKMQLSQLRAFMQALLTNGLVTDTVLLQVYGRRRLLQPAADESRVLVSTDGVLGT
jgi:hypothetical protein